MRERAGGRLRAVLGGWGLLLSVGCSGGGDESTGAAEIAGRGTDACHEWQTEICAFAADHCNLMTRADCVDDVVAITCVSDQTALDCATAFSTASCMMVPPGCDLSEMADRDAAGAYCAQFTQAACDLEARCGISMLETCLSEAPTRLDCTRAVGAGLELERCLSELATLACTASALPAACQSVIKLM